MSVGYGKSNVRIAADFALSSRGISVAKRTDVLRTVADLRQALADLNPMLRVITSHAPFTGVILVENGGAIEIRAPREASPTPQGKVQ